MENRLAKILYLASLLILLLAACQSAEKEEGPAVAYQEYYQACENGQFETAKTYLDEEAQKQIEAIGICGFTHDAINRYEIERGGTERTFSEEPTEEVNDNSAVITWFDDQGNVAIVNLVKTGDGWKITQTIWSD